jgi:hypothetical protein
VGTQRSPNFVGYFYGDVHGSSFLLLCRKLRRESPGPSGS